MKHKIALLAAILVCCPMIVRAEDSHVKNQTETTRARMGEMTDQARFHKIIDQTAEVYAAIAKGPHGEVPASTLKNARCIAVLPNVLTGAIVVGGSHGEGLASCVDSSGSWSQPAPISLNQGSIGLQVGGKSADLVLFIQNNDAVKALKSGEFTLGADVSAVAGNYDSSVDTSTAGVVVFTRTAGLFAGAAVNGSKIGRDKDELAKFYGKNTDYTALLEGRESPDNSGYTKNLTRLFP